MARKLAWLLAAVSGLLLLIGLPGLVAARLLGAASAAPPAAVGDWPMYGHDAQRTNDNPAETLLAPANVAQWVQRWQANIGSGSSPPSGAPSVANGQVYVGSSVASGNNFFAYDAVTGAFGWGANLGYISACSNVGIGSTSAISGTTLVVGGGDSAYYGLNATTGAQLWRHAMNVGSSGFPWESPLISGNRTYVGIASYCDNPSVRGEVRRLDVTGGSQQANQYFVNSGERGGGIWNSPALSPDGSTLVVVSGEDYTCSACTYTRSMITLDANTLAILQYNQQGPTGADSDFGTTPAIFHDSQNRLLVGANHKNGTFYTYVLTNVTAGPLWSRATGTDVGMMPAYDPGFGSGGTLFIEGSGSQLYAVDPATGTNRWTPVGSGTVHGNMAVANGLILLNNGAAGLRVLRESDGSLLRTITPPNAGGAYSGVAVANGFVYWLSGGYLNAWSLPAGQATATPTLVPSNTPPTTRTGTPTNTLTPTPTRTPTNIATNTRTATPSPTLTFGETTNTPTRTGTPALSATSTVVGPSLTPTPLLASPTLTSIPIVTGTPTPVPPSPTRTITPNLPPNTPTVTGTPTNTPGGPSTTPTLTATVCPIQFSDVPLNDPFYLYIRCLACRQIISGYSTSPPCVSGGVPCFQPAANVTRGQTAKIVANAAGFTDAIPSTQQTFEDVPPNNAFWIYIERLALPGRGYISGYTCGQAPAGPCVAPQNRPYFLPFNNVTRGQIAKIDANAAGLTGAIPSTQQTFEDVPPSNTFWLYIERLAPLQVISGYTCGQAPAGPCVPPDNRPYFLSFNNVTRGQTAKIVANTFFPNCQTPSARRR